MTTINDLNKSISEMSEEDLKNTILDLRRSRRIPKATNKKKTKVAKSADISTVLNAMSEEDKLKLLEDLEA